MCIQIFAYLSTRRKTRDRFRPDGPLGPHNRIHGWDVLNGCSITLWPLGVTDENSDGEKGKLTFVNEADYPC